MLFHDLSRLAADRVFTVLGEPAVFVSATSGAQRVTVIVDQDVTPEPVGERYQVNEIKWNVSLLMAETDTPKKGDTIQTDAGREFRIIDVVRRDSSAVECSCREL
jgi:hypothetical protein